VGEATLASKGDEKRRGRRRRAKALIMLVSRMFWSPAARLIKELARGAARVVW
jgi:hypothetical protein